MPVSCSAKPGHRETPYPTTHYPPTRYRTTRYRTTPAWSRLLPEVLLWHWFAFGGLVVVLLTLDLVVFHRYDHAPSLGESALWTVFWIGLGVLFNVWMWWWRGDEAGILFLTGFLVEKSLSLDNIFVFVVIFRFFRVPLKYQYRVLFWGVLGAIVLRLVFILAGIELIHRFEWVMPAFGLFLVYTAYKLAAHADAEVHPENNIVLRWARRMFRVTRGDHREHGHNFFAREDGHWAVTPMFLVLIVIESTDVIFAIDSVPAIIGITHDRFIAFTSNIFAILGLRALYFLLAGVVEMFRYLHYGLAAVLGFVGLKMLGHYWAPELAPPPLISLGIIASLLVVSIVASVWAAAREKRRLEKSPPESVAAGDAPEATPVAQVEAQADMEVQSSERGDY